MWAEALGLKTWRLPNRQRRSPSTAGLTQVFLSASGP